MTIITELERLYPSPHCELRFENPFQLLIATLLSAQCTDMRVNEVTARLFAKYKTVLDFAAIEHATLEDEIKTLGLFRAKAKNIRALCRTLCEHYHGEVPRTMEELLTLPGVGRKTASVVVFNAFGLPAMAVDTHVFRVSRRLGWATGKTPLAVEEELCGLLPKDLWGRVHHLLIWHGRRLCYARSPACAECPLQELVACRL